MNKILTIRDTECGGKPTIYAAEIDCTNFNTLLDHMKKGLPNQEILDEDVDALKEQGYTWIAERFCVEIIYVGEGTETQDDRVVKFSPFKKLKVTAEVDWDIPPEDDGDDHPDRHFEVTFLSAYLKEKGFITENEDDPMVWDFDETAFGKWFGGYLTSYTDFCHKRFTCKIQPMN